MDIWVPLRDPTSGRLSLQFGGGLAVRSTLSQWVFYSRNFAFYEGQVCVCVCVIDGWTYQ